MSNLKTGKKTIVLDSEAVVCYLNFIRTLLKMSKKGG